MQPQGKNEPPLGELPVLSVQVSQTILPPDNQPRIQRGSGVGLGPTEYAPRLQALIQLLQDRGIYTDDVVVVSGVNLPSMMRTESYTLVEIPRISKEILVCNEVGEATFVSEKMLARATYTQCTKEQLLEFPGVYRVIFYTAQQWEADIMAVLFREGEVIGQKINVRDREEMGRAIRERMTAEEWVRMSCKERRELEVHGKRIIAIARLFGSAGIPLRRNLDHLELGALIWGENEPCIRTPLAEERTNAAALAELGDDQTKWAEEILRRATPQEWTTWNAEQRLAFKIHGAGLETIGKIFGVQKSPSNNTIARLEIAARVWGESSMC